MTDSKMLDTRNAVERIDLLGKSVPLTRSQRMHLRAMLDRMESARKATRNGILPDQWRGQANRSVVEQDNQEQTYKELDAAATLTADEQAVYDAYIEEIRGLAAQARPVIESLFGRDVLSEIDYTLRMIVDQSSKPKNLSPVDNVQEVMQAWLENNGSLKDPKFHKHPLLITDFFSEAERQLKFMADMVHLAPAVRDALKVVGHPQMQQELAQRFGTNYQRDVVRTLAKASGTYHRAPLSAGERMAEWFGRNIAVNRLAAKISPIFNNHVGGLVLYSSLMRPTEAARFMARIAVEQRRPLDFTATRELMTDPFMYDRWAGSAQRLVRPSYHSKDAWKPKHKLSMWYRKMQEALLAPMKWAEMRNAAILYRHYLAEGLSRSEAVAKVSLMTRESQNPTSPFEESPFVDTVKGNPLGAMFLMFQGQPNVAQNIILRKAVEAKQAARAGDKRKANAIRGEIAWAINGLAMNAALTVGFRAALFALRGGGKDDDDKKRAADAAVDVATDLANTVAPGTGMMVQNLAAPLFDRDPFVLQSTVGAVATNLVRASRQGGELLREGWDEDRAIAMTTELVRGVGALLGAPTEGLKQALELTGTMPKPDFSQRHNVAKHFARYGGESGDQIKAYIDKFFEANPDSTLGLGLPGKTFTVRGERYEFTDEEHDAIVQKAMARAARRIGTVDPESTSDRKMERIKRVLQMAVDYERNRVIRQIPRSELAERKKKKVK
jgi:hypothetical protein